MVAVNLNTSCSYILFTFIIIFLLHRFFRSLSRNGLPPGPRELPILGHMHLLWSSLPRSLQDLADTYGPLINIHMGSLRVFVVSDSDTAKQILKTHDLDFASKFVFGPRQFNVYKGAEFFNAPYGPYWKFMKKLCMTKLFSGYQLDRFVAIREEETLVLLRSLVERSRNGEACDLSLEFTVLTTKILSKMVMGKRCRQNSDLPFEIRKIVRDILACATKFGFMELYGPLRDLDVFGNGKRLRSSIWRYDEIVEKILKEYENDMSNDDVEGEKDKDFVDILLDTYNDPNAELKLTMNQIKFYILELFMASLDTTSAALQWTMTELINNQDIFTKIRDEIKSVLGKTNRLIKESDLQKLPYLQAAIKETLRLHPVSPLLRRESNRDMKINGYNVKSGTKIFINAYGIMRDPTTYKDPDKFVPERFIVVEQNTETKMSYSQQNMLELNGQDVNYLAFGSGRRGCLGASHVSLVLSLTIGSLVQCFNWTMKGDKDKIKIKLPTGLAASGIAGGSSLICSPELCFDPFRHQTK